MGAEEGETAAGEARATTLTSAVAAGRGRGRGANISISARVANGDDGPQGAAPAQAGGLEHHDQGAEEEMASTRGKVALVPGHPQGGLVVLRSRPAGKAVGKAAPSQGALRALTV